MCWKNSFDNFFIKSIEDENRFLNAWHYDIRPHYALSTTWAIDVRSNYTLQLSMILFVLVEYSFFMSLLRQSTFMGFLNLASCLVVALHVWGSKLFDFFVIGSTFLCWMLQFTVTKTLRIIKAKCWVFQSVWWKLACIISPFASLRSFTTQRHVWFRCCSICVYLW